MVHTHSKANIINLLAELDNKSLTNHIHFYLEAELDNRLLRIVNTQTGNFIMEGTWT